MSKISRNTTAKIKIKELIERSEVALSHSDIQKKMEGLCDRVTIYRVLDRMVESGEVHKIVNIDGVLNFARCKEKHCADGHHQHNHVHFSCEKCKMVECLENEIPDIHLPKGYAFKESNITIVGVCPKCGE